MSPGYPGDTDNHKRPVEPVSPGGMSGKMRQALEALVLQRWEDGYAAGRASVFYALLSGLALGGFAGFVIGVATTLLVQFVHHTRP